MTVMVFLIGLAICEVLWPARALPGRWPVRLVNLGTGLANVLLLRLVLPAGLATWSDMALTQWGRTPVSPWLGLLLLDLALYWQHRMFHRLPLLWRLHAPHHSDTELDLTTGTRFHPLEALVSAFWKGLIILLVGIGPATVVAFETVLACASLLSHANLRSPGRQFAWLDRVWMTPALHRVHHGLAREQQNANLSAGFALWDHLFGTWSAALSLDRVGLRGLSGVTLGPLRGFLSLPFGNRYLD